MCGSLLPHRLSWEYRISNPLRTRNRIDVQSLLGNMHLSVIMFFFPTSAPTFNSGTYGLFINQICIRDSDSRFNVIQFISQDRRSYSGTEDFRNLTKAELRNRSLIPDFGIRRQPVKVQLLL